MIRCLSLFSGIGGLDLGLEATGRFQIVAQSEIDPYACRVLKKHWPDVPNLGDITELTEESLEGIGPVDLVCGGFPCQDLSVAGKGEGIRGSRSGLFYEMARVVRLVRPRHWLMENVPRILAGGGGEWFGEVLRVVAEGGYDAQWDCIPAAAVGAPHRRDRVFIVAHANGGRLQRQRESEYKEQQSPSRDQFDRRSMRRRGQGEKMADAGRQESLFRAGENRGICPPTSVAADAISDELWEQSGGRGGQGGSGAPFAGFDGTSRPVADNSRLKQRRRTEPVPSEQPAAQRNRKAWPRPTGEWLPEPDVGRVAHGVPHRVDRLRGLGNAVVPQVATYIAQRILDTEDD